jgi:hypothetical protein
VPENFARDLSGFDERRHSTAAEKPKIFDSEHPPAAFAAIH